MFRLDLQRLTLLLALVAGLLTFANSFFAGYTTQRDQLFEQTLEANRAYARKLADTTDRFFPRRSMSPRHGTAKRSASSSTAISSTEQ